MSWCSRRSLLLGGGTVFLLPACQFEPALGSGGPADGLFGQVQIREPGNRDTFSMTQRLEERLGRGGEQSRFTLDYSLSVSAVRLGTDTDGTTQRIQLTGRANYSLRRRGENGTLTSGSVNNFAGYSNTGNTVSTSAARSDARERLLQILADDIVERIYLASPDIAL